MRHVTDIIAACGIDQFAFMRPEAREFYLSRGAAVHKATELYDLGTLDLSTLDPRLEPYLAAYKKFRREVGGECEEIEFRVECKRLNFCGRLDRVIKGARLTLKYSRLVLDIKTSAVSASAAIQTAAYRMGYKKMASRAALALQDDGNYKLALFNDDILDEGAWLACLTLATWKERKGLWTPKERAS